MSAFLIKKLVSNLVHLIPGLLVLMLLAMPLLRVYPRLAKGILLFALCTLLATASAPVSNVLVSYLEDQHPVIENIPSDTHSILILGSGHFWAQDRPANSVLSAVGLSRVSEGLRLWRQDPTVSLVTSGAKFGSVVAHADVAASMAIAGGVPSDKIIRLAKTLDTAQEIREVMEYMKENPVNGRDRLLIVSSATHLPRAALMMESFDISHTLAPTDFLYTNAPWYLFSSKHIDNTDRAIHEFVGMLWHKLAS